MSNPKLIDFKHQAALAVRRVRDQKARYQLDDYHLITPIRKSTPEFGRDFTNESQVLVEAKRMAIFAKGCALGNEMSAREAERQAFAETIQRRLKGGEKR